MISLRRPHIASRATRKFTNRPHDVFKFSHASVNSRELGKIGDGVAMIPHNSFSTGADIVLRHDITSHIPNPRCLCHTCCKGNDATTTRVTCLFLSGALNDEIVQMYRLLLRVWHSNTWERSKHHSKFPHCRAPRVSRVCILGFASIE
jgi:hypothetical protein